MSITFIVLTNLYIYIGESYMFCALLKCSVRSCHLIDVLLFSSIVTGIYSGVCCAVLRIDSNSFDGASVIDSVDESNSIVHDGNVQDDSSTYKDCSILNIVGDMDDSVLLGVMKCLLHIAIKHNDYDLIKALQLSEMSNYASKENDATALQGAAVNKHYIIEFLRDNIHTAPYESEGGLLTCAIPFGNNKLIELLIESGAKVNSLDADQYMPLHTAVRYGEIEIVKILLNAGADVNHECLSIHIHNEPNPVRKFFLRTCRKFITPLHILAIACDDFEMVKILLDRKANTNDCSKVHDVLDVLVGMAIDVNSNNILTALLSSNAQMDTQKIFSDTRLQHAVARSRSPEVIETIISHGDKKSTNIKSICLDTKLPLAITNEYNDLVKVLINNGANPNYINIHGNGLLHIAAYEIKNNRIISSKIVDIFECLISAGVNVNCQTPYGFTALMIVVMKPYYENSDTLDTIENIISMLLSNGADINITDSLGNTALHYTALNGYHAYSSLLLKYGANRDIKSQYGITAAQYAGTDLVTSTMISEAPFVAMQPARMKTIVRNSIRSRLIENRTEKQSLSKMISALGLPEIIRDFLRNPM
ncbi:MAG: ankyrin repeat domain-containing protein [Candidatus Endonucleobacter bathymodioli]|uniref:Ankyrin repeat domain-containing protein n=1 Tax=Candidatus Endonucleibacter bathymodioli TaxID=539814 RepID=A0AA90NMM4_9GAMM|nr:ankyrin repeat domain-containing protein [Candidatus Endonucleobacter bathymodioli]